MIRRIFSVIFVLSIILTACSKKSSAPAPGTATLVTPATNSICTTGTITSATQSAVSFSWNSAANAETYDLTTVNLLTNAVATQNVSATTATVTLLQNTPYAWYITSRSSKTSKTAKSDVWKFYNSGAGVVTYAPFPAQITAPTFGQVITYTTGLTVNLTWVGSSVSNNVVAYNVYFGPNSNPSLYRSFLTDNFVNNIAVSANTTYYWRIVTIDANGNISDSGTYNFFVK